MIPEVTGSRDERIKKSRGMSKGMCKCLEGLEDERSKQTCEEGVKS